MMTAAGSESSFSSTTTKTLLQENNNNIMNETKNNDDNNSTITNIFLLHGWAQNNHVFAIKTKSLAKRLRQQPGYNVIYIQAPHLLPTSSIVTITEEVTVCNNNDNNIIRTQQHKVEIENGKRQNARAWFYYSKTDPADATLSQSEIPLEYVGLQESIDHVIQSIISQTSNNNNCENNVDEKIKIFNVLLAFSQGAVFVHALVAKLSNNNNDDIQQLLLQDTGNNSIIGGKSSTLIDCVILIGGFAAMEKSLTSLPPLDDNEKSITTQFRNHYYYYSFKIPIPSLHVFGINDTSVRPEMSRKLYDKFLNGRILRHEKGHVIPQSKIYCKQIIDFINDHSK